jgi:hypothetical protein
MLLLMRGGSNKSSLQLCGESLSPPPRLHVFLWLLANNKVLIHDNLAKRRQVDDMTCLFCTEFESVAHLFFTCCVAHLVWSEICEIANTPVIADF